MQHLIKKQTIDLILPEKLDAFRMQQLASRHYWQDVLPVLEKVFEEFSNEEELIRIEQVEIDLGVISEKEMIQDTWSDALLVKIREQLEKQLGKRAQGNAQFRERNTFSICRQWLFYMQRGYLPWNTLMVTPAWYNQVLEALAIDFNSVTSLRKIIQESPLVARRIILQHEDHFLITLIEILTAENQRELLAAIGELQLVFSFAGSISPKSARTKENSKEIWEMVLRLASAERKLTTEKLVEEVLVKNLTGPSVITDIIADRSSKFPVILFVLKRLEEKPELFSENKPAVIREPRETLESKETKSIENIDEEGIFVQYAGVVLVHPFLHSLFKRLQLVKEGKFITDYTQQKALYLLHYLAMGNTTAEEFELAVPKLLCAWPMEMPVEKNVELNNDELSEADNMLQAAVDQWAVLKNTSIDGLREGYLLRNGKLFKKKDILHLQIEAKSIDVLLDQLPWNLSMIKLPWMKELLRVEWR